MRLRWLFLLLTISLVDIGSPIADPGHSKRHRNRGVSVLSGVGALGDSITAEQQFVGSRANARGFIEQLAELRGINFGAFDPSRPGNQRAGYDYNWAIGGQGVFRAGIDDLVDGLAGQIASGDVTLAVINLATIDLALRYSDIYSGSLSGVELDDLINSIAGELINIVDRLESAGDVRIVLGNCADFGVSFTVRDHPALTDPIGRMLFTQAAMTLNARIDDFADANGYPVLDIFNWANLGFSGLTIDGIFIDGSMYQNAVPNPDHFFEDSQHPGSVAHGLLANALLGAVNDAWGEYTAPLSDQEIVLAAGLVPSGDGATYFPIDTFYHVNHAPYADAGRSYRVGKHGSVWLSARRSYDFEDDRTELSYEWDLDNDGVFDVSGERIRFTADDLGSKKIQRIRLKVTDTRGGSDIDFATVSRTGQGHTKRGPQPPWGRQPKNRK